MISQQRLEKIVTEWAAKGFSAGQIARKTGVPTQRIQATMHKLNGRSPVTASSETRQKRRQEQRQYKRRTAALTEPRTP